MPLRTVLFSIALLCSLSGKGNISEGPVPPIGQVTGGPFISAQCIITSELLKVDLRPLEHLEEGVVNAKYNFINDTINDSLSLVFVARNLAGKNFKIFLDGKPITGDTTSNILPPAHWLIPRGLPWNPGNFGWADSSLVYDSTGWTHAQRYNDLHDQFNDYIIFSIAVDSGQRELEVMYNVQVPQSYRGSIISHCFSYILSPAQDWKEYNDFNLELYIPKDWKLKSNLALTPVNDHFAGYWKELPADYFYVITGASDENADKLNLLYLLTGWGLLLLLIVWLLNAFARRHAKGQISKGVYWTIALWLMPAGAIIFFVIYAWRDEWLKLWYGDQLDPGFTHGDAYTWIFGFIPLSILGAGIGYAIKAILVGIHRNRHDMS